MQAFGMMLRPTMYRSHSNYQMCSGNVCDSLNLQMNQCWMDMAARQNLYNVPIMNFGNFSPYGVISSMDYLLDPSYAIGQYLSIQMASGQCGFSALQMPTTNFNEGFFPGSQSPTTSLGESWTSSLSEEEKTAKEQYGKLKLLLETCLKNIGRAIIKEDKEFVKNALKKTGKWSEKLDALKEAYKKIDEKEIKKAMTQIQSKDKTVDYQTLLKDIGYNFDNDNSYKSDCNKDLKDKLQEIVKQEDFEDLREVIQNLGTENNVLNLLSIWEGEEITCSGSLVSYLLDNVKDDNGIPELADALIEKGETISNDANLSPETQSYIKNLIQDLKDCKDAIYYNGSDSQNSVEAHGPFIEVFYDLYTCLRLAEIKIAQKDIKNDYGFIADISKSDTDFIKEENFLIEETIEDLKENESFEEEKIEYHLSKIKLTA